MKKVGIIMGSDSDLPILRKTMDTLASLGIPYECHVYSAHRTPEQARQFALNARANGFGVLIAAAGMAAHLAGAIAANTTLPVIGIPCKSTCLDGIDALLSTVMMPSGIPVATVAINGGVNAALLSAQILAVEDADLARRLDEKRESDARKVLEKDAALAQELVNAALLSAQILAVEDADLARRLDEKRESDARKVLEKDAALAQELG